MNVVGECDVASLPCESSAPPITVAVGRAALIPS